MLAALLAYWPLAVPSSAQDKDGMEEFEEVDPYTRGEPERMKRLGYVSYGPFVWRDGDSTLAVQESMGGMPILWVETEHFRIGSSLVTYKLSGDKEEKARLQEEIGRLRKKLGKLKTPKKELDPWLRLHLWAQRAEELYASFHADFGLAPADYAEKGPYLGKTDKFLLLLCQRKSEFNRHVRTYLQVDTNHAYRYDWADGGMFYGANVEVMKESWDSPAGKPFDAILHGKVVAGLVTNFVDGYRQNRYGSPRWLAYALPHVYVRRIDPRWVNAVGYEEGRSIREEDYKWEPRVASLVKNKFFASTEEMFGWAKYEDMNTRDHLVAWSRLEYLLNEAEGDRRGFLTALCDVAPEGTPEAQQAALVERQTKALAECFGMTPEELDKAWARWVKKTYKKR